MKKILLLLISLCQLHMQGAIEASLGLLSQSLEVLSKSIIPGEKTEDVAKKEPWIVSDCFEKYNDSGSVARVRLKFGCPIIKDRLFSPGIMVEVSELLAQQVVDQKLPSASIDKVTIYAPGSPIDKDIKRLLDELKHSAASNNGIEGVSIVARQLTILLFYKESIDPESWNDNFDSEIKDTAIKVEWRQFMKAFRDKMQEEGWPYRTNPE